MTSVVTNFDSLESTHSSAAFALRIMRSEWQTLKEQKDCKNRNPWFVNPKEAPPPRAGKSSPSLRFAAGLRYAPHFPLCCKCGWSPPDWPLLPSAPRRVAGVHAMHPKTKTNPRQVEIFALPDTWRPSCLRPGHLSKGKRP